MKTKTKSLLVYKFIHLRNRELARLLYGEVTPKTLWSVRKLKSRAKLTLLKSHTFSTKAYIPVSFSNFFISPETLLKVLVLKSIAKSLLLKINESSTKAYIPLNFSNFFHISYINYVGSTPSGREPQDVVAHQTMLIFQI